MHKKKEWEDLNPEIQKRYLQKASYLIEYGYMQEEDVESLAIKIYLKEE